MLRLFLTRSFNAARSGVQLAKPKQQLDNLLSVCRAPRCLCTVSSAGRDAAQTDEDPPGRKVEVDLDGWKSIMKAQAMSKEQQVSDGLGDGDEEKEADEDMGASSLKASQELVAMWRLAGKLVPKEMTEEAYKALSELTTKSGKKKYLKFLAIKERYKLTRKQKQEQKNAEREASLGDGDDEEKSHLEPENSYMMRVQSASMSANMGWRAAQAMRFGQPLVFDFSYENDMSAREIENTVKQMLEVEGYNRSSKDPFHLHYCNLRLDGACYKEFIKRYNSSVWERLLITSTEQHYTDVFNKKELVYLTADSPNVLQTFDPSKVYIIGALVDRSIHSGLSLANAKRLKLPTARLPIEKYLTWVLGAKNLTLDQMMKIMVTIQETGDWKEAFKFIPTRKHSGFRDEVNSGIVKGNTAEFVTHIRSTAHVDSTFAKAYKSKEYSRKTETDVRKNWGPMTRLRVSLKSNMEAKKGAANTKKWWDDE